MEIQKYNNNVNFQARLFKSNIKQNLDRWNRIGKIFENATKDSPDDKFFLVKSAFKDTHYVTLKNNHNALDAERLPDDKFGPWLLHLSDEEIATKFVKMFKIIKLRSKAIVEYRKADTQKQFELEEKYAKEILKIAGKDKTIAGGTNSSIFGGNFVHGLLRHRAMFPEEFPNRML